MDTSFCLCNCWTGYLPCCWGVQVLLASCSEEAEQSVCNKDPVHVFLGVKQQGLGQLLWFPVFCVPRCLSWLTTSSWKQVLGSVLPLRAFMYRLEGEGRAWDGGRTGLVLSYPEGGAVREVRDIQGRPFTRKPLPPGDL